MSDDGDVELGDRLNDLGALILERIGDADAKVLLYAEVDESGDTVFLVFRRPFTWSRFIKAVKAISKTEAP